MMCIGGAGTDALVGGDLEGHDLADNAAAVVPDGFLLYLGAHGDENTGGAKVVAMMIDGIHLDGGHVGDKHGGVEGACIDDGTGQKTVAVEKLQASNEESSEEGDAEEQVDQLVGGIVGTGLAIVIDGAVDLFGDVKDGILGITDDLDYRFFTGLVAVCFENNEAHGDVIAGIDALVDDETVDIGLFRDGADIGGDEHAHEADVDALCAFFTDILGNGTAIEVHFTVVGGIHAGGHDVGDHLEKATQPFDDFSVCSASEHRLKSVPFFKKMGNMPLGHVEGATQM